MARSGTRSRVNIPSPWMRPCTRSWASPCWCRPGRRCTSRWVTSWCWRREPRSPSRGGAASSKSIRAASSWWGPPSSSTLAVAQGQDPAGRGKYQLIQKCCSRYQSLERLNFKRVPYVLQQSMRIFL